MKSLQKKKIVLKQTKVEAKIQVQKKSVKAIQLKKADVLQ